MKIIKTMTGMKCNLQEIIGQNNNVKTEISKYRIHRCKTVYKEADNLIQRKELVNSYECYLLSKRRLSFYNRKQGKFKMG